MNFTLFICVLAVGFISGVLSIKYVSDSRKVALLAGYALLGIGLGLTVPPTFNLIVCITLFLFGAVQVISRLAGDLIDRVRVARAAKQFIEVEHG